MQKIVVILGPTATGKSDLAVKLAKRFNGEIISADSRQVYKGLDIGTGKITRAEMREVPHHLLDVINPRRQFSVSQYEQSANKMIEEILSRGKLPIICGGTGFYIQAITEGLALPPVPPNEKLREQLATKSAPELYEILRKLDAARAATIDRNNPRRLARAIEIAETFGKVSALKKNPKYKSAKIGLSLSPEELKKRIRARLKKRIKVGMIAEAKKLHAGGLSWKRMEELGLEYRYLSRHLKHQISKDEMTHLLEKEIWRYAKRQMTWFKRDKNIQWFIPPLSREDIGKIQTLIHGD